MMVHIPEVLTPEQVARCRDVMAKADWVDGNVTAGHQSRKVKHNLQLPEEFARSARARRHGAARRSTAARCSSRRCCRKQVFPPLFNRYDAGMTFGSHVDNAIRSHPQHAGAHPHRRLGDAVHLGARGLRRRRTGGRGHLRQPRGQAAGRRHDRLSGAPACTTSRRSRAARASRRSSGPRA